MIDAFTAKSIASNQFRCVSNAVEDAARHGLCECEVYLDDIEKRSMYTNTLTKMGYTVYSDIVPAIVKTDDDLVPGKRLLLNISWHVPKQEVHDE
jgi:hypothetical protein